jgi:hypothetical protein
LAAIRESFVAGQTYKRELGALARVETANGIAPKFEQKREASFAGKIDLTAPFACPAQSKVHCFGGT